ncbi:MAG: hypothetical protein KC464_03975, partial [Myxococcales bacterium]|nr:hypothetical protein [Myxococcales bacterium]
MPPTDFVNRGQALVAAGNYQEAVKVCRLGLLGRPTAIDARLILAQALLALRRYDEVLAEMRVALELDSHLAAAHGLKGEALLRKGDVHAAREVLMQARALAPGDPSIAALVAETDLAIASGGNRLPSGADGDPQTKHYPTHRGVRDGLLPHHGAPGSQSFTRPTQVDAIPGAASAPFERTGTVEIDPEESGIELVDDDLGDVIDPPSPSGRTSVLVDDDLVEVADDDVLDADELLDPSGSRSIDLGGSSRETVAGRPGARAGSRRGSAGPDLGAMFPEDDATGVLDALLGELPGGGPPGASVAAAEIP